MTGLSSGGPKAHQTGSLSAHEIIVLPTRALRRGEEDYALAFAIPSDTKGLIHVVGQNSLDTRELDGFDCGNIYYSKYCPTLIFHDVFVPWERVFMCGEVEFASEAVGRFSAYHKQSHGGCKSGKIDAMIGAALMMIDYNGTAKVGHHMEKIVDMIYRAETLFGCSLASSYEGRKEPSGTYFIDLVMANPSKIHEGKEMAGVGRILTDIAGGYVADLPSDKDLAIPEVGPLTEKYLKGVANPHQEPNQNASSGRKDGDGECRYDIRHSRGGGSAAAHRITILRESDLEYKESCAKRLAGIE